MRICNKCNREKDESDFYKSNSRKDGLQGKCKACDLERVKSYYKLNKEARNKTSVLGRAKRRASAREFILNYLVGKACLDCDNNDIRVLQFDHIKDKRFNISYLVCNGYSTKVIAQELSNCEIRCANCHSIKTCEEFGHYRSLEITGASRME